MQARQMPEKPVARPQNPCFSSGPCAKRPGWALGTLSGAVVGRSHRSAEGKARLRAVIDRHRALLGIPADYRIGILPGSDTGAFEAALWSLLGPRGVDVFVWEVFGEVWCHDITHNLALEDVRVFRAPYGALPDMTQADPARDCVFTWNGTTGGVCVPNADWIKPERTGLSFCDATSAVFACALPWEKLDVTTWSWQKALGGEAAHGILVLSPRAVERLEKSAPVRPVPRLFSLVRDGKVIEGIFAGETINTPSMLAVEDCLDALQWVERSGGLPGMMARVGANYAALAGWVAKTDWVAFLAAGTAVRSKTSVCLKIIAPWFAEKDEPGQRTFIKAMAGHLAQENVAFDIAGHAAAPPCLRIWCGATVESADVAALGPWLDWACARAQAD